MDPEDVKDEAESEEEETAELDPADLEAIAGGANFTGAF